MKWAFVGDAQDMVEEIAWVKTLNVSNVWFLKNLIKLLIAHAQMISRFFNVKQKHTQGDTSYV